MHVQGFHHVAIQVHDVEAAARFYEQALRLEPMARHFTPQGALRSVWLRLADGFLALEKTSSAAAPERFRDPRPGLLVLALRISRDDRDGWLAHLAELGIAVQHQSRWTVYFQDLEGNRLALSHHPEDPLGQT